MGSDSVSIKDSKLSNRNMSSKTSATKKRGPLRHIAIEKSIEGPSRKKRATASSPAGRSVDSDSEEEPMEELGEFGEFPEASNKSTSAKAHSRLRDQAREQRRDIYSEELFAKEGGKHSSSGETFLAAKRIHGPVAHI